ncbi:MAG: hypothetical protein ACR2IK_04170 [Chloroflexota bacterium]
MSHGSATEDSQRLGEDVDNDNVYLREYLGLTRRRPQLAGGYEAWLRAPDGPSMYARRVACVRRYAFGVPNRAGLEVIARHAPIVELGAGTGYWAYLLQNRGVDIVAYDLAPPDQTSNAYQFEPRTWTSVLRGGVEVLDQYSARALFLCWPGYRDTFAQEALERFAGNVLIYVGERAGGHTASDTFFDRLDREWAPGEQVAIPRWVGADDCLMIYYRREPL